MKKDEKISSGDQSVTRKIMSRMTSKSNASRAPVPDRISSVIIKGIATESKTEDDLKSTVQRNLNVRGQKIKSASIKEWHPMLLFVN